MNTANLRKLLDEATPRPWVHEDGSYWIRDPAQPEYIGLVECHDSAMNAALIVELVNNADELLAENERLRKALLPLCCFGVESYEYDDDMPEEIEDPQEAWEWRLANSSPDTGLMTEMYQRDILAARAALEQKS